MSSSPTTLRDLRGGPDHPKKEDGEAESASEPGGQTSSVTGARRALSGLRRLQQAFTDHPPKRDRQSAAEAASETRGRLAERLRQVEAAAVRLEHELRGVPDPLAPRPIEPVATEPAPAPA